MTSFPFPAPESGPIAARARDIAPFHVMELLKRAQSLEAEGRDIIHMEVGEPDFPTPAPVIQAAQSYLAQGRVAYTPALGLSALREAISRHYADRFALDVPSDRIVVTAGASGALLLTLALLTETGDEWLLPDPGYPCNRNFVRAFGGVSHDLPVAAEDGFQPTADTVKAAWGDRTRGVILASPSNPTGTLIAPARLAAILEHVRGKAGALLVDEIYQGLTYDQPPFSALSLGEDVFVINSFSKYFGMTGWRLGWMVLPSAYLRDAEKLAQHYFISPSSPAQHAALAAFHPETIAELEERRSEFSRRRTVLQDGLMALGFRIPAQPAGAFYIYADVSQLCDDSFEFSRHLLESAGVATTPGIDFGNQNPERWLRLAYTTRIERIEEAIVRLQHTLGQRVAGK